MKRPTFKAFKKKILQDAEVKKEYEALRPEFEKLMEIKNLKPRIYDEDNNEIIPPEGATGFVAGMEAMQWTFGSGHTAKFIYKPDPYEGPLEETCEDKFKFESVPTILNDSWKYTLNIPYPPKRSYINGKNFWKYRQRFRNKRRTGKEYCEFL